MVSLSTDEATGSRRGANVEWKPGELENNIYNMMGFLILKAF